MEGVEEENLTTPEEFLDLVKLFQSHGFSRKTVSQTKQVEVDCVRSILNKNCFIKY